MPQEIALPWSVYGAFAIEKIICSLSLRKIKWPEKILQGVISFYHLRYKMSIWIKCLRRIFPLLSIHSYTNTWIQKYGNLSGEFCLIITATSDFYTSEFYFQIYVLPLTQVSSWPGMIVITIYLTIYIPS